MTEPWPEEDPDKWNRCELGGLDLPGLALVKIRLSEELDVKKPKGAHGATITRQGYNPAKVTILLRMWTAEQFRTFQSIVAPLRPKVGSGRTAKPLDIAHPKTRLWGIERVAIQEVQDDNGDRGDVYDVTLECIEHFPPPSVDATKTDGKADSLKANDNTIRSQRPPALPSTTGGKP